MIVLKRGVGDGFYSSYFLIWIQAGFDQQIIIIVYFYLDTNSFLKTGCDNWITRNIITSGHPLRYYNGRYRFSPVHSERTQYDVLLKRDDNALRNLNFTVCTYSPNRLKNDNCTLIHVWIIIIIMITTITQSAAQLVHSNEIEFLHFWLINHFIIRMAVR